MSGTFAIGLTRGPGEGGMFERYTDRARRAVRLAQEEAADLGHDSVGTEHLLLGLIGEGGGVAFKALDALGVTAEAVNEAVCRRHPAGTCRSDGWLPWTPRFRKVAELALREALQLGCSYVATEHLLLALIREDGDTGALALADYIRAARLPAVSRAGGGKLAVDGREYRRRRRNRVKRRR